MRLAVLVAAAFLAVAWLTYHQQPRSHRPATGPELVLGQWYCCLLDDHPVRVNDPAPLGGFGGRSGRPVSD